MTDFFITVSGPRAADFERVFGSARVPVISPVPILAQLPGRPPGDAIYLLDLAAINAERRHLLVAHLAEKFRLPASEIEADLDREGMPILAEDCSVTVLNPAKWLT